MRTRYLRSSGYRRRLVRHAVTPWNQPLPPILAVTRYARIVLADCEDALAELNSGPTGVEWRRRWVTTVALLRAVGHVLSKVDRAADADLANAIDASFAALKASKPCPAIFWEFIDRERNNVLKMYRIGAGQGVTVRPGTAIVDAELRQIGSLASGPTTYEHLMRTGPFADKDPRALVAEAIQWWRSYLDAIDQRARSP